MNLQELLQEADPLQHEGMPPLEQRDVCRRFVLASLADVEASPRPRGLSRAVFTGAAASGLLIACLLGLRITVPEVVQAAVRFEVHLAEDRPGPGLREAKLPDSGRVIYLHPEAVLTNSDISSARIIPGTDANHYGVSVEFNAAGARKMAAATANHLGKPVAILLDGKIAAAPTLRSPIGSSAVISGQFTKAEVERIVKGITLR